MRRSSLFWGLCLLIAGALFLMQNIGIIKVNVWNILWPILIIFVGVWIIAGRYIKLPVEEEFVSIPLEGATKASFHIKHGAGRLNVSSGTDAGFGLQGTFTGGLDYQKQRIRESLDVILESKMMDFPILISPERTMDWTFGLTKDIPLSLKFDTGANDAQIDLRDANVTDITLSTGASATAITLPSQSGFTQVEVHSGAASLIVHIPENVAAKIRLTGGLSSVNINQARFPKGIDSYRSTDYDSAINRVDLNIEMGVGSVSID